MNAYQKIKKAMLENERLLIDHIKRANRTGDGYGAARNFCSMTWFNAIDRLIEKKIIVWRTSRRYSRTGYWLR